VCCFSFAVLSQEIGWEERLLNDLFCVGWDVNVNLYSIDQSTQHTKIFHFRQSCGPGASAQQLWTRGFILALPLLWHTCSLGLFVIIVLHMLVLISVSGQDIRQYIVWKVER